MAKRATQKEVMAVPTPQWTRTWHPVSHADVIETTEKALKHTGIKILNKEYSLSKDGAKMFGTWKLDIATNAGFYMLGFRNALDKALALGYVAGNHITNCSNLQFAGDYIRFRKHTGRLDLDELKTISLDAVDSAVIEMKKLDEWHEGLHELWVPEEDQKLFTYDLFDRGVLNPGKFKQFQQAVEEEKQIDHGYDYPSLYNLHGAATRCMRDWSLLQTSQATPKLNTLCDDYIKLAA